MTMVKNEDVTDNGKTINYQINEFFHTIQGEGLNAGCSATFIRLQGCPVGCSWCDTRYTWAKGGFAIKARTLIESPDYLNGFLRPLVVITGGEPTLYNLDELIIELRRRGQTLYGYDFRIQLETSGLKGMKGALWPDYVTWSPKENLQFQADSEIRRTASEVKWVVDQRLELVTILDSIKQGGFTPRGVTHILMPEGTPPAQNNIDKALSWIAQYPIFRLGDRLQWRIGVK